MRKQTNAEPFRDRELLLLTKENPLVFLGAAFAPLTRAAEVALRETSYL
jgi:hypothetical protein